MTSAPAGVSIDSAAQTQTTIANTRAQAVLLRVGLWAVLLLAAVLRLNYVVELWQSPLFLINMLHGLDMATYYGEALAFAAGRLATPTSPFSQAPLYPLFLAGFVRLGATPAALTIVQVGLGVLACALLYELGRRLVSPGVGVLAATMYAGYPLAWYYTGLLLSENLLVVLLLALALLTISALEGGRSVPWLAVGVLCGLGTLTKANVAIILPALIVAAYMRRQQHPRLVPIGAAGLAFGIVILPAVAFNSVAAGSLQFVSSLGGHLWLAGNSAYSSGLYELPCGPALMPWTAAFWVLQAHKSLLFLSNQEFGNNTNIEVFRAYLPILMPAVVGFGSLAGLGLLGLLLPPTPRGRWLGPMLVLGVYAASIVAFAVVGRYRLPAAALLCLPAAAVGVRLPRLMRCQPLRTLLAMSLVIVLSVAANIDLPFDVSVPFAHGNAASVFAEAGDSVSAQAELGLARGARLAIEANDRHACSQLPQF